MYKINSGIGEHSVPCRFVYLGAISPKQHMQLVSTGLPANKPQCVWLQQGEAQTLGPGGSHR